MTTAGKMSRKRNFVLMKKEELKILFNPLIEAKCIRKREKDYTNRNLS